jgi:hypothetical protein
MDDAHAEALKMGVRYYEGRPCPRGHTRRVVSSKNCLQCQLDRSRAAKRKPEPAVSGPPRPSLAAMSRRDCIECGPETLFAGSVCVNCGHDSTPGKRRTKRTHWNGAPLRAPIAEDAGNLLSLMAAKA